MVRKRVGSLGKQAAVVAVGLAVGLGGAAVIRNAGATRPHAQPPSVKALPFSAARAPENAIAPTDPGPPPTLAQEPADGRAAVASFLQALADGKPAQAYPLLDAAGRERFPTVAAWIADQANRMNPLTFEVGTGTADPTAGIDVGVTSTHRSSVDAFRGLVPGRSQSQWRATQEAAGWRVAAEPVSFRPILPADTTAPAVVSAWVSKLAACDTAGAAPYQFDAHLYGPPTLLTAPCAKRGAWTVGAPVGLDRASDPRAFLAAFGPEVGSWARLVPVQGPGSTFLAAVAPIGDSWQVLGVAVE